MGRSKKRAVVYVVALCGIWLAVQVGLFFFGPTNEISTPHFGIRHGKDTTRYLEAAALLLDGKLPAGKPAWYLGYELFVAFFLWTGTGQIGVIFAQVSLTLVAAYCLGRLASRLYDRRTGLLAALFYLGYLEIHIWNFYLLSESLFVSMVVISIFLVVDSKGWWQTVLASAVVAFTTIIRPNGIILPASIGAYALYSLYRARRYKAMAAVGCLCLAAVPFVFKLLSAALTVVAHPVRGYIRGRIIYSYDAGDVKMPGALPLGLDQVGNPVVAMLYFIISRPIYFLKLAGMKLFYLFAHVRPYYSGFHNYAILSALVPTYALAALGFMERSEHPEGKFLLASLCLFQSLVVVLTAASWDGRFLLVILPGLFVFAARGAWRLWDGAGALVSVSWRTSW